MKIWITGTTKDKKTGTNQVLLDKLYDLDYPEIFDLLKYIAKQYWVKKLTVKMKVEKFWQINIDL